MVEKIDSDGAGENLVDYVTQIGPVTHKLDKGFIPAMRVPGLFFLSEDLKKQTFGEMDSYVTASEERQPSFLPSIMQLANVATLPGVVGHSTGLPDIHSGYGFAIGNVAAFDVSNDEAIVSPGGVGFDINCGIRLLQTNLTYQQIESDLDKLGYEISKAVPCGLKKSGPIEISNNDLKEILVSGLDWAIKKNYAPESDKLICENKGCFEKADPKNVSDKAKARGISTICSLGTGNHYAEIQRVVEIFDEETARVMGITQIDQIVVMIHTGSRGLGHQVATDYTKQCNENLEEAEIKPCDPQLSYATIKSELGQKYLSAMAAAANFAFANRALVTYQIKQAFMSVLDKKITDLQINLVYDVCHNIAKFEEHDVVGDDGKSEKKTLLVHRKGATRAFPPGHPEVPEKYKKCGQPVFVGGSMGTSSYILVGTDQSMKSSFGSTCHGAGRALPRSKCRNLLSPDDLKKCLEEKNIKIFCKNFEKLVDEAPEAYKDVNRVVETCEIAGLSKRVVKVVPVAVLKD